MSIPRIGGCSGCGIDNNESNLYMAKSVIQNHYNVTGNKFFIVERNGKIMLRSEYELQASLILFPDTKLIEYDFR